MTRDPQIADRLAADWRQADVGPRLEALLEYAERLTLRPAATDRSDVERLRAAGLDDEAILHACEIVSYFNFVNRMADGLGVRLEDGWSDPIIEMPPSDASGGA